MSDLPQTFEIKGIDREDFESSGLRHGSESLETGPIDQNRFPSPRSFADRAKQGLAEIQLSLTEIGLFSAAVSAGEALPATRKQQLREASVQNVEGLLRVLADEVQHLGNRLRVTQQGQVGGKLEPLSRPPLRPPDLLSPLLAPVDPGLGGPDRGEELGDFRVVQAGLRPLRGAHR